MKGYIDANGTASTRSTHLQLETPTPDGFFRAPYPKLESQALGNEKLGVDNVGRLELGELWDKVFDRDWIVGGFGREKEACGPAE